MKYLIILLLLVGCASVEKPPPNTEKPCVEYYTSWDHLWWMKCLEPLDKGDKNENFCKRQATNVRETD